MSGAQSTSAETGERVDRAAEQLYGVSPKDFVTTRNSLVAAAKAAGDKDAATQITALRRPNTAAWLVNLLVRDASDQISGLLELGTAMRHAQARLSADELRRLTVQRQQVVRALASQAHALAADAGEQVSRDALHQVADTLQAGLADPGFADQIRAGRLTHPLSYSGFGPAGLRLAPEPSAAQLHSSEPDDVDEVDEDLEKRRAEAKEAVDAAARKVVRAKRGVATAKETQTRADRELARAEISVAEKQAALDEAVAGADRARSRVETALGQRAEADRALADAEERLRLATAEQAAIVKA